MTLQVWIETTGPKNVAGMLNVDVSTVYKWKRGKVLPRAKEMVNIHRRSKRKVTYKDMIETAAARD